MGEKPIIILDINPNDIINVVRINIFCSNIINKDIITQTHTTDITKSCIQVVGWSVMPVPYWVNEFLIPEIEKYLSKNQKNKLIDISYFFALTQHIQTIVPKKLNLAS